MRYENSNCLIIRVSFQNIGHIEVGQEWGDLDEKKRMEA
jgi:hypothetical protein